MGNNNINLDNSQNISENNASAPETGGEAAAVNTASGYHHDKERRLWRNVDGKDSILISESYIEVVALTCTKESLEWSNRISFDDMDGKRRYIDIPCKILLETRETQKLLADSGFSKRWCTVNVVNYLKSAEPAKRMLQINRTGWISDTEYICPSFTVPTRDNYFLLGDTNNYGFAKRGDFKGWQERICKNCEGNHILTFALCVGLSGVLLRFFPTLSTTIINLVGKTSIGKTTALRVSASLWGGHKFIRQWRATDNALEGSAEYYNDALMILDELGQIDSKKVSEIVYMLGNEKGKGRSKADATLKKVKEWSISILSSGEIGIADKIEEGGKKAKGGILVRCIDIDAHISEEFGVFNTLHGFNSGAEFSNYFKTQTAEYYGTAAEAFVSHLSKHNIESIMDLYNDLKQRIFEEFGLCEADFEVQRMAEAFALFYTAGALASADNYGVFTHNIEGIESAIYAVFRRLLEDRGGKKSCEEQEIIQHIVGFLMQHEARFRKIGIIIREDGSEVKGLPEDAKINCLGYMEAYPDRTIYYINPKLFKEEICNGLSYKIVRKILLKAGVLQVESDNSDKRIFISGSQKRMTNLIIKKTFDDTKI